MNGMEWVPARTSSYGSAGGLLKEPQLQWQLGRHIFFDVKQSGKDMVGEKGENFGVCLVRTH